VSGEPAAAEAASEEKIEDVVTEEGAETGAPTQTSQLTVEDLLTLVETLTSERDASIEARARLQAEFENYRKRVAKQELEQSARAAETLVTQLLPSLDAFEGALAHSGVGVEPVWNALWSTLQREGMEKLVPTGEPFDPNLHEAVAHEPGEGGPPLVTDVFRSGYMWKGRVIRPAMVKVRD
jgi:molecular chaperone GrpE